MNKLAKRAWFALALAGVLLLGMGVIVVRYFIDSPDWVTFQNSPHVYTDGVMNSGKIVDRGGAVVLDATNGKSYADSASLRRSMLHLLGDREGNITPFLLQEYGSELVGFDRINGTYSTGKREGRMTLTVSADVQRTAQAALDGRPVPELPPLAERCDALVRQIERSAEFRNEKVALLEARRHYCWYLKGVKYANYYKDQINHMETLEDLYRVTAGIKRDLSD